MSLSYLSICPARGRGLLYLKVDIILVKKKKKKKEKKRKKNQIIRVVFFRTRQCTRLHRLGLQKCGKLKKKKKKKKWCVFGQTNFGKDMTDKLSKTHAKMRI